MGGSLSTRTCLAPNGVVDFCMTKMATRSQSWGVDFADCQGYLVLMLTQTVKVNEHRIVRLRVVDTVATPAITSDDPVAQGQSNRVGQRCQRILQCGQKAKIGDISF